MGVAALVLALVSAHYDIPRSAATVQRLREHLLIGKDSFVPPDTDGTTGIEIGIQYRFFKVIKVDLASGQLVTKVWRRMRWMDHRLSWDPADWDNVTQVVIYPGAHSGGAPDAIDNNMWTPQVVLYNGITPQDQVMEEGAAWVTYTGAVWHSTPGVIDVSCRFAGLSSFPYDELTCPIEIASWSYSDLVTNLTFMEDRACVDLTTENPTAGTTYAEYQLNGYTCNTAWSKSAALAVPQLGSCTRLRVRLAALGGSSAQGQVGPLAAQPPPRVLQPAASKVSDSTAYDHLGKKNTVEYPCCADTPYTALIVTLKLKRSSFFYELVIIVPGILFTLLCCAHRPRFEPQHARSRPRVHIVCAPLHGSSQSWRSSLTPPTSARGWASAVRCC